MPRVAVIAVLIVASAAITLARLGGEGPAAAGPPAPGVSAHPPVAVSVPALAARIELEARYAPLLRAGRAAEAQAAAEEANVLKLRGGVLASRFGLARC